MQAMERQLAEKKAKKKGFWGKVGGFASDFGGAMVDMAANPLETGKRLASEAKNTFVNPIIDMPKAFDPSSGLSMVDRANTALAGGFALADAATPFMPEGAITNSLRRAAMERAVAAEPSEAMTYGIHHSLTPGLKTILPSQAGNQVTALDAIPGSAYFWSSQGKDLTAAVDQVPFQWNNAIWRRSDMIAEPPSFYNAEPSAYLVRTPTRKVLEDANVPGSVARRVEGQLPVVKDISGMIENPEAMKKALRHYGLGSRAVPDVAKIAERGKAMDMLATMRRHAENY